MRVVSGTLGGRKIKAVPGNNTRPTLDKVKESVFNALGQYFSGGKVLDLYAGSGNLGIEAISRGANQGVFVEKDFVAYKIIQENLTSLDITSCSEVYKLDAFKALSLFLEKQYKFDYVFLDPPYRKQKINQILTKLEDDQLLTENAVVVAECLKEDELMKVYKNLEFYKEYRYGITKITIYKKNGDNNE